jgi:hypothetical protein
LSDGSEVLGTPAVELAEVASAAWQLRDIEIMWEGERIWPPPEVDWVELPISPAVRIRYPQSFFGPGARPTIDYWFYVDDRLLVLTWVGAAWTDQVPASSPPNLEEMAESIRLIE